MEHRRAGPGLRRLPGDPLRPSGFLSTSGSYEKQFEEDGVTYHHILDPKTGYPAESGLVGVTIWSDSGVLSDALSTACFVLGMEESLPLLEQFDSGAVFITEDHQIYVTENLADAFTWIWTTTPGRGGVRRLWKRNGCLSPLGMLLCGGLLLLAGALFLAQSLAPQGTVAIVEQNGVEVARRQLSQLTQTETLILEGENSVEVTIQFSPQGAGGGGLHLPGPGLRQNRDADPGRGVGHLSAGADLPAAGGQRQRCGRGGLLTRQKHGIRQPSQGLGSR